MFYKLVILVLLCIRYVSFIEVTFLICVLIVFIQILESPDTILFVGPIHLHKGNCLVLNCMLVIGLTYSNNNDKK